MPYYENIDPSIGPDDFNVPIYGVSIDNHTADHPPHKHLRGQLLYSDTGTLNLHSDDFYFILTPSKAAWIPSNCIHACTTKKAALFRSLYIDTALFPDLPKQLGIINVTPLLKSLILKACDFPESYAQESPEQRLGSVIADEIGSADTHPFWVMKPNDSRLQTLFHVLISDPENTQSADALADTVHITSRTLTRLCQKELGLNFEKWRAQIKLLHAITLLSTGKTTTQTSQVLGYSNDSAFITMFKRMTGKTPSAFTRR